MNRKWRHYNIALLKQERNRKLQVMTDCDSRCREKLWNYMLNRFRSMCSDPCCTHISYMESLEFHKKRIGLWKNKVHPQGACWNTKRKTGKALGKHVITFSFKLVNWYFIQVFLPIILFHGFDVTPYSCVLRSYDLFMCVSPTWRNISKLKLLWNFLQSTCKTLTHRLDQGCCCYNLAWHCCGCSCV